MATFHGTFDDLQNAVSRVGQLGEWSDIPTGKQFRTKDGAVLVWHSSTGTLQFQGKAASRDKLQAALLSEIEQPVAGTAETATSSDARHRVLSSTVTIKP